MEDKEFKIYFDSFHGGADILMTRRITYEFKKHVDVRYSQFLVLVVCLMFLNGCPKIETHYSENSKPLEFSEVVTADGLAKDQLYSAALSWFGETFRSAKNVIEVQDREAGRIISKALFQYEPIVFVSSAGIRGVVRYSVTVEVKDGRYRYTVGNFFHEGSGSGRLSFGPITTDTKCPISFFGYITESSTQETWDHLKTCSKNESDILIASLKKRMALAAGKKNDNW